MRFSELKRLYKKAAKDELKRVADAIERDMKAECPKDTGELARSIHQEVRRKGNEIFITSDLPQMYFTNFGNTPSGGGKIYPKKGEYMWFMSSKKYNLPQKKNGYYYAKEINPYEGKNWIKTIADKYRS